MRTKFGCGISLAVAGLALAVFCASTARATEVEATMDDQSSTIDKDNKLHLKASADMNAPVDRVFDALTHPEKVAKYDANVTGIKQVSHTADGEVLEFTGSTLPIPNAPRALQVKYSFDPAKKHLTAESYGKAPIQFHGEYTLKPTKDGKGTEVDYTSVSTSAGPVMGIDPPKFMREQFVLDAFMRNLHNASEYIMKGGK